MPSIRRGDTKVPRDFSDIRDVVEDCLRLGTADCAGATFDLSSGKPQEAEGILDLLREITGHDPGLIADPALSRTDEIPSVRGCDARHRTMLGRGHIVPIRDKLRSLLDFHGTED